MGEVRLLWFGMVVEVFVIVEVMRCNRLGGEELN